MNVRRERDKEREKHTDAKKSRPNRSEDCFKAYTYLFFSFSKWIFQFACSVHPTCLPHSSSLLMISLSLSCSHLFPILSCASALCAMSLYSAIFWIYGRCVGDHFKQNCSISSSSLPSTQSFFVFVQSLFFFSLYQRCRINIFPFNFLKCHARFSPLNCVWLILRFE